MKRWIIIAAILLFPTWAAAAADPGEIGVVLMHGKWGDQSNLRDLADQLNEAGFKTIRPEMPWSGRRLFDKSYAEGQAELDQAAEQLRAMGATRIVVAGHSLGANAAFAAAGRRADWAGIALIAPGHFPEGAVAKEKTGSSIAKANAMVQAGQGGESGSFLSLNDGNRTKMIDAKAADYLSYYGPESPAAMSLNAAMLHPLPIIWIAPKFDKLTGAFEKLVLPHVPAGVEIQRIDVNAGHMDAPNVGASALLNWLRGLQL